MTATTDSGEARQQQHERIERFRAQLDTGFLCLFALCLASVLVWIVYALATPASVAERNRHAEIVLLLLAVPIGYSAGAAMALLGYALWTLKVQGFTQQVLSAVKEGVAQQYSAVLKRAAKRGARCELARPRG